MIAFNRLVARVAALTTITLATLSAQMSGNYTINPIGSGSRNYTSFQAAIFDLWKQGMNGAVTFTVSSGTYTQAALVPIQGMSATTPLTFKSLTKHGAILTRPGWGTAFTIDLSTTSRPVVGVVFDGLKFANAREGIEARSPATDIEVRDCHFASSVGGSAISGSGVRWEIHHCLFEPTNQSAYALYLTGCDDVSIHHNEVRLTKSRGVRIASTSKSSGAKPTRIYNNVIRGTMNSGYSAIRLDLASHGVEVSHNSILINGTNVWVNCIRLGGHFTNPNKVVNNILANTYVSYSSLMVEALSKYDYQLDGNIYYKPAGPIIDVYRGASYSSLPPWQQASQQDKNSFAADPKFKGGLSAPYDLHLAPTSPAVGKAVGTPSYVKDDFDGNPRGARIDIGAYQAQLPFMTFGKGCGGTLGNVPIMGSTGSPRIGSNDFTVTLRNALGGTGVRAWLAIGVSNQKWGSIPLPISFGGGCDLLVSPDLLVSLGVGGGSGPGNGTATVKMVIPNDPKLLGTRTYFQWGVVDPGAKGIGLAFSDGGILSL